MKYLVISTLLLCVAFACAEPVGPETGLAPLEVVETSFTVPWDVVGRFGHTDAGPRSLACLDDGRVALLSADGRRVLRFTADGALLAETVIPVMADDLLPLSGGWVFLENLTRSVAVADVDGGLREKIALPVGLAPVTSLGFEDGDLAVTTAYQDSLSLRTPSLAAIREGIPCGDGQRCQLVSEKAAPGEARTFQLLVAAAPKLEGDGLRFEDGGRLPAEASAARLVGRDGEDLLVMTDTVLADGSVQRELLWINPEMGLERRVEIAVRGGAVPFRQVVACPDGGAAWMQETDGGTSVTRTGGAR